MMRRRSAGLETRERPDQFQTVTAPKETRHIFRGWSFAEPTTGSGHAFEEKRNLHLQDKRDLLQSAGANSIGALLVFLDLLKRQTEGVAKLLLAHTEHHAAHADTAPD